MKKLMKAFATIAAVAMLGIAMSACSDDSDGDTGPGFSAAPIGDAGSKVVPSAPSDVGTITMNGTTYATLSEAFAAIGASGDYTITLTEGTYTEENGLRYQGGANIRIEGPATDNLYGVKCLIKGKGANMASEGGNQAGRELLEIAGSGNVVLKNIALQNIYTAAGDCQAEAFGFDSTGTAAAYNCSFYSHQDTTRTTGKAWFYKCYVEGDVDFIWMEQSGRVALYEECRLRAIKGRTKDGKPVDAYFTAPRVSVVEEGSYGKGLVIYNSQLEVDSGMTAYLGRNPWGTNSAYYNDVSIIKTKLYGTLASDVWKGSAMKNPNNPCGGFGVDKTFYQGGNRSDDLIAKEFAGRNNILNRVFDSETNTMCKDAGNAIWDTTTLATEFNATPDLSLALLAGETDLQMISVNLVGDANSITSDEYSTPVYSVKTTSVAESKKGHGYMIQNDGYLVLKNVPAYCKVTLLGCAYGAGSGTVTGPNSFTTTFETQKVPASDGSAAGAFVYNAGVVGDLTLSFTAGNAYIHGFQIREYASLTPATGIKINASKTTIVVDEPLQLTATLSPSDVTLKAMKWTTSDSSIVNISDKGLIAGVKVGQATITVKTCDGTDLTDTVTINVVENTNKPQVGKSYDYPLKGGVGNPYFSSDLNLQVFGDSDNGSHGLVMKKNSYAKLKVAGNVKVTLERCRYDNGLPMTVTNSNGEVVAEVVFPEGVSSQKTDEDTLDFVYVGPADTLTMIWGNGSGACYLHRVNVAPAGNIVTASGINVTATDNATTVKVGKKLQLNATITPDNATVKVVSWSSSDTSKATVDSTGLVTGVAAGPVTITATAKDGSGVTGTKDITVENNDATACGKYDFMAEAFNSKTGTSSDGCLKWNFYDAPSVKGHGARIYGNDTYIKVKVGGPCDLVFGLCQFNDEAGILKIEDGNGTEVVTKTGSDIATGSDGELVIPYTGEATELTISFNQKDNYYHYLNIK